MAEFSERYPKNVPGKYYIDCQCTDCDFCRETAPHHIARDDAHGYSYVFRQPTTPEEIAACEEAVADCPTKAVGNDGDRHDWTQPIRYDWSKCLTRSRGVTSSPVTKQTPRESLFGRLLRYIRGHSPHA